MEMCSSREEQRDEQLRHDWPCHQDSSQRWLDVLQRHFLHQLCPGSHDYDGKGKALVLYLVHVGSNVT